MPRPSHQVTESISLKSPAECSDAELAAFESRLIESGETASPALPERLRRAERLAFVQDAAGHLAAIGALKRPKPEHCAGVFKRAAVPASPDTFSLELGWLAGAGEALSRIVAALGADAGARPVFIIIRTDETALRAILEQHGFQVAGMPYASPRGAYSNQVCIRA